MIKLIYHSLRRILAKYWLSFHKDVKIIGITGSYGKTNTSYAINKVLSAQFKVLQTDLNLDTNYNLPITILKLRDQQVLVLEYGIDKKGEMLNHLTLVKPNIAVLTGIAPVHTDADHFGSLEILIKEKSYLLQALESNDYAVINYDDEKARAISSKTKAKVIFYGTDEKNCQVWTSKPEVDFSGTSFDLHFGKEKVHIKTPLIGVHHLLNLGAAAVVAQILGLTLEEIATQMEKLESLDGRVSIEKGLLETTWINDSRRANLASTLAGLQVLKDLPGKRKIAVLGEMREMGDYTETGHRDVGKFIAKIKPDLLVTVGKNTNFIAEEAKEAVRVYESKDVFEAAEILKKELKSQDLVYLKGSLLAHMERIPLLLQGKSVDTDDVASKRYKIYR